MFSLLARLVSFIQNHSSRFRSAQEVIKFIRKMAGFRTFYCSFLLCPQWPILFLLWMVTRSPLFACWSKKWFTARRPHESGRIIDFWNRRKVGRLGSFMTPLHMMIRGERSSSNERRGFIYWFVEHWNSTCCFSPLLRWFYVNRRSQLGRWKEELGVQKGPGRVVRASNHRLMISEMTSQ